MRKDGATFPFSSPANARSQFTSIILEVMMQFTMFDYYRKRVEHFSSDLSLAQAKRAMISIDRSPYCKRRGEYALVIGRLLFATRGELNELNGANMIGWISGDSNHSTIYAINSFAVNGNGLGIFCGLFFSLILIFFTGNLYFALICLISVVVLIVALDIGSARDSVVKCFIEDAIMAHEGDERRHWQKRGEAFGLIVTDRIGVLFGALQTMDIGGYFILDRECSDNLQVQRKADGFEILSRPGGPNRLLRAERVDAVSAVDRFKFDEAMEIAFAWLTDGPTPAFLKWSEAA
jgi:hypothetical protein